MPRLFLSLTRNHQRRDLSSLSWRNSQIPSSTTPDPSIPSAFFQNHRHLILAIAGNGRDQLITSNGQPGICSLYIPSLLKHIVDEFGG